MFKYLISEILSALAGIIAIIFIIRYLWQKQHFHKAIQQKWLYIPVALLTISLFTGFLANKTYPPDFAMPMFSHSHAPGGVPPNLPFANIINFFLHYNRFEKVADIGADPNAVPNEAQKPGTDGIVRLNLHVQEVISEIAPGIYNNYWTFNRQVPGPMFRVKEGDTVEVTITNDASSLHDHNVDLHAVNGPGGGATLTHVSPGETKAFRFKTLNPGLYVYHCAMPNVSTHNSHGQYGLILVDPKDSNLSFSRVDKEFYIMQGELYTTGQLGKKGLMAFDTQALLDGRPNYVTFNGKIESTPRMHAKVGDKIRIFVGNGGVNLISSFHVIGEVFDTVYPEANIGGSIEHNVQTTAVLPGGASIVEFKVDVPGKYMIVDHALARMNKGAWAVLDVTGEENPSIYTQTKGSQSDSMTDHHMNAGMDHTTTNNQITETIPFGKLENVKWIWVNGVYAPGNDYEKAKAIQISSPNAYKLTLNNQSAIISGDCNSLTATPKYDVGTTGTISFKAVAVTRKSCNGTRENDFLKMLNDVISYDFSEDGYLMLRLRSGGHMAFRHNE